MEIEDMRDNVDCGFRITTMEYMHHGKDDRGRYKVMTSMYGLGIFNKQYIHIKTTRYNNKPHISVSHGGGVYKKQSRLAALVCGKSRTVAAIGDIFLYGRTV